jgi:DNA phosphorothioation-dependent restriction protein DptG
MERTHAEQLALNERREGRLKQKMKTYAEVAKKSGEEMEDMQQAVLKLIDKGMWLCASPWYRAESTQWRSIMDTSPLNPVNSMFRRCLVSL